MAFVDKMRSTVFSFSTDNLSKSSLPSAIAQMEKEVAKKVAKFVSECKANESKFKDPDFGPVDSDELGAEALYGSPPKAPKGAYPKPDKIRWDRPQYADGEEDSDGDDGDEDLAADDDDEDEDDDDEFDSEFGDEDSSCDVWCKKVSLTQSSLALRKTRRRATTKLN